MDEVDCEEEALQAMQRAVAEEIAKCTDVTLLDLIYKLLVQG